MLRNPTLKATLVVVACVLVGGCGEVFADLDVRKQTIAEVWFSPAAVYSGTKTYVEVHTRLEGGTASVQSHSLTGANNIKLLHDNIDFFPGTCPEANDELTEAAVAAAAAGDQSPIADSGEYVFCGALEVGSFETTTTVTVTFQFWNGTESVFGTAPLTVNVGQ